MEGGDVKSVPRLYHELEPFRQLKLFDSILEFFALLTSLNEGLKLP